MRLRKVSMWFFSIVLFALGANAMFLVLIKQSYHTVVASQDHRQSALNLANELRQETERLASLVRSYTVTGEPRYLLYYYDILGVRQGEKPAPANLNPGSYWDNVIAGRVRHSLLKEGVKRSVTDLMKSQGFRGDELLALQRVLDATAEMNKVEQIAFAATQGLYNPQSKEFVSDGQPRLDFASQLVNSHEYSALRADLSTAVDALMTLVDHRTSADVAAAEGSLERWILLSLVSEFSRALKMVISVAKSLALRMMVGAKSASGRPAGTFHWGFMAWVDLPKRAWSPLLRMRPKSSLPPVCSKITAESSRSVAVSFWRA